MNAYPSLFFQPLDIYTAVKKDSQIAFRFLLPEANILNQDVIPWVWKGDQEV